MPSLLDYRAPARQRPLFGQALVAQQRALEGAANRAQDAAKFNIREGRMAEQAERSMSIRDRAVTVADAIRRAQEAQKTAEETALINQANAFSTAITAIAEVAANDEKAGLKIAQILAKNPAALSTKNKGLSDALMKQYISKQEDIVSHRASMAKMTEEQNKAAEIALQKQRAKEANLVLAESDTGPEKFTAPKATVEKFQSYEEARKKYPNASIRGETLPDGVFLLEGISSGAPKAPSAVDSLMGQPAAQAAGAVPAAPVAGAPGAAPMSTPSPVAPAPAGNRIPIPADAVFKKSKSTGKVHAYAPDGKYIGEMSDAGN